MSKEDAQESLSIIENTKNQTIKSIAATYASPILILWGVICFTAYLGTHFFVKWSWHIWMILNSVGAVGTYLICFLQFKKSIPTKIDNSSKIGLKIFLFWAFLLAYIFIWLNIIKPVNGLQVNAFIITATMFAYIVFGLWINSNFMIWLGLAVTVCTLIGFYLIPHNYYCLWMAFTAGSLITGTGILTRYSWK
jgi:MFS family permease